LRYTIQPADDLRGVWRIVSADRTRAAYFITESYAGRRTGSPELRFSEMGGEHFLSRVVLDRDGTGVAVAWTAQSMERALLRSEAHTAD
jgi:hypothetical protein